MPDSGVFVGDSDEVSEYMITVACECYSNQERVGETLARLPDFDGQLVWGSPSTPNSRTVLGGSDMVLVVADKNSLLMALARVSAYGQLERPALLIYLQGDDSVLMEEIPGLVLSLSHLDAGFSSLVDALFTPVIPPGSVCIEWVDTRHILLMEGQMVIVEACGPEPEAAMDTAVAELRLRASGRKFLGLQASILCSQDKLAARHVCRLMSACRGVIAADTAFFIGAPLLSRFESGRYEVRLAAKIACASSQETRS